MIEGNSGCLVTIDNIKVVKTAIDYPADRLIRQAQKQMMYEDMFHAVKIPEIYQITNNSFSMEFVAGFNFVQYFTNQSVDTVIHALDDVFRFISECTTKSRNVRIDADFFIAKIQDIERKSGDNLHYLIEIVPNEVIVPVGYCHGDLTLSNIIFGDKTCLIDFLDSYIESPIIDICKLRQDTQFRWSYNKLTGYFDRTKLDIILNALDERVVQFAQCTDWYNNYYTLFSLINLARLLPYTKDKLHDEIYKHINSSCLREIESLSKHAT